MAKKVNGVKSAHNRTINLGHVDDAKTQAVRTYGRVIARKVLSSNVSNTFRIRLPERHSPNEQLSHRITFKPQTTYHTCVCTRII